MRRVIDGVPQRVLPRDFQIHPFRPKAICINWLRYRVGSYPGVRIELPLKSVNEERCPGLKEGGWLLELTNKVSAPSGGQAYWPLAYTRIYAFMGCHPADVCPPFLTGDDDKSSHSTPHKVILTTPPACPPLSVVLQIPVYASGPDIPDYLMMDLRGLKISDKVMASQIELNDGLLLVRAACAPPFLSQNHS